MRPANRCVRIQKAVTDVCVILDTDKLETYALVSLYHDDAYFLCVIHHDLDEACPSILSTETLTFTTFLFESYFTK